MVNLDKIYHSLAKLYYFLQISFFNGYALPPFHAFFDVTYRCNLRCNMCHSLPLVDGSDDPDNIKKELTSDQIKKLIRKLPRKSLITFTGGEPFCRNDMDEILSSACKDYKCHVISNGTMITRDIAETLIELRSRSIMKSGLFMIGFSIEGPEDIHNEIVKKEGAFQKTIATIELIQKMKNQKRSKYPMIHLTAVITSRNVSYLNFIYSLAKDLKLDYCNFVLVNTSQFSRNIISNNYDALYIVPPPASPIEASLLSAQLDLLERYASSNKTPKIRFSPKGVTREEIIKHYSTGLNYKDYRCYVSWSKIGFSAFGDVICCPYIKIGTVLEKNYDILWNKIPYKQFREKLKREKSFPRCVGCCHSEYVGSKNS